MNKLKKLVNYIVAFIIVVLVWQALVIFGQYEEALFPSPLKVWNGIVSLIVDGTFFIHLKVSLFRFLAGYLLAVVVGILLGLLLGRMTKVWSVIDPIVQVLRPVSPIAWSPFIVLWFGIGDMPAIVIIFIAAVFPILLSTVSAVKKVDRMYLKVAENFGIKTSQLLIKVIFPAAFPFIANGLHIAIGSAWVFLVAGEMVGAQSGLGFLIVDARNSLRLDLVMAGIIFIGISGLLIDKAVRFFESWIEKQWGVTLTK